MKYIKDFFSNKFLLFVSVLALALVGPQFVGLQKIIADDGGYPWANATTVNVGSGNYEWGYSTCPSNNSVCMSMTGTLNGTTYGESDPWYYYIRNCTSYMAWKIDSVFNKNVSGWGNANTWDTNATSAGYTVYSGSSHTPQVGEIAQWEGTITNPAGHVAFVSAVNSGVGTLAEYNSGMPKNGNNQSQWGLFYNGRTTASNSAGTPDHYIHFGTVQTPASVMPVSSQLTTGNVQHVFTGTSAGNVIDTSWTGSGSPTSWIVGSSLGAAITSVSSQYVGGVIHVYAATSAGSVVDIYWGGGQSLGQRQVASYSSGSYYLTSLIDSGSYQHVEVGTPSGNVYDLYWTGIGTVGSQTVGSSLGAAINSLSMQYPSGVVHVYAATSGGSIVDIYWGGGQSLGQRQVSSYSSGNYYLTSLVDSGGYQHVEVGTPAGNVYDLYWTGIGSVGSQTVGSSLGAAISSLSMQYPSGVVHVYAATNAGSTVDIYWGGGQSLGQRQIWSRSDTTANGVSSRIDGSGVQHVYTGITAGSIYDTSFTGVGTASTTQVK